MAEAEHPQAEAFCRRLEGNKDDGDDLYQDALVKAWHSFGGLRRQESFKPWLYRIIVNIFKSKIRRRRWFGTSDSSNELTEQSYNPSPGLNARLWLERALRAVSADDKAIVMLFEIEGWSVSEIADMYDKPEGTIKSRLSRTRKKMRRELGRYFPENNDKSITIEADYAMPRSKTSLE